MKSSRISAILALFALFAGATVIAACSSDSSSQPELKIAETISTQELYGIAVAKENTALLSAVNGSLEKMKKDGRLKDLYQKWFGFDPPKSVLNGITKNPGQAPSSGSKSVDSELISDGKLTIGSDIPYPPFEFGKEPPYKGFDIELLNAIGKDLGLEVEFQDTGFETLWTDVAQGKFDLAVSAMTITPERQKEVNFSDPYYEAQQALVVLADSDIKSVKDLNGKIVGAQNGTTGETFAKDETDAKEVRGLPNGPAAIDAVRLSQVDATIIDKDPAEDAVK